MASSNQTVQIEHDYEPLQETNKALIAAMRADEMAPEADLAELLKKSVENGRYFTSLAPDAAAPPPAPGQNTVSQAQSSSENKPLPPTNSLTYSHTIPLPAALQKELEGVVATSFMGIFEEIGCVWMTVDSRLFLWEFLSQDFTSYEVPQGQVIVSVGLVRPKKGVFKDKIEWCLVVTTPVECMLLALYRDTGNMNGSNYRNGTHNMPSRPLHSSQRGSLTIKESNFVMQTELVTMVSVASTKDGRVFLGGRDGNLYEMFYEYETDDYYQARSGAKRIFSAIQSSLTSDGASNRCKCRKISHTQSSFVGALIPKGILRVVDYTFGGKSANDHALVNIVIDSERNAMYTLSMGGEIICYDTTGGKLMKKSHISATQCCKSFVEAVKQGRTYPSNNNCKFEGGLNVAKSNLGGMEGARHLLAMEDNTVLSKKNALNSLFRPISLHIIPSVSSKSLTLLAITAGGLRLYFSSVNPNPYGRISSSSLSQRIVLQFVRASLPVETIKSVKVSHADNLKGILPVVGAQSSGSIVQSRRNALFAYKAFYGHDGTFIYAAESIDQLPSTQKKLQNHVVGTLPEASLRGSVQQKVQSQTIPRMGSTTDEKPPTRNLSYSESFNLPLFKAGSVSCGKVWEISQVKSDYDSSSESYINHLLRTSSTPSDSELQREPPLPFIPPRNKKNVLGGTSSPVSLVASLFSPKKSNETALLSRATGGPIYQVISGASSEFLGNDSRSLVQKRMTRDDINSLHQDVFRAKAVVALGTSVSEQILSSSRTAQKQILVLVNGGLQVVNQSSALDKFKESLSLFSGQQSIDKIKQLEIEDFFRAFGDKEACTMAISLALSGTDNSIARKALNVALQYAGRPEIMESTATVQGAVSVGGTLGQQSSLFPDQSPGAFHASNIYQGMVSLVSRLLRPYWFKPAVVVTKFHSSSGPVMHPGVSAKAIILLDGNALENLRRPLYALQDLLKENYARAVSTSPFRHKQVVRNERSGNKMDWEGDVDMLQDDSLVSRMLQQRQSQMTSTLQRRPVINQGGAHFQEMTLIHSLYRLVSRTNQLLSLLSLLNRVQVVQSLPEVEWGLLTGISFSQLVTTPVGQERIAMLLSSLINESTDVTVPLKYLENNSSEIDQFVKQLTEQAYLFFSPGERLALKGFKAARLALAVEDKSRKNIFKEEAADCLRQAARYWKSPSLICGRFSKTHQEGTNCIESPLDKAAASLLAIDLPGAVVDVCLACASNFGGTVRGTRGDEDADFIDLGSTMFEWETGLYQHNKLSGNNRIGRGSSQGVSAAVSGVDVTDEEARKKCYEVILKSLDMLLTDPNKGRSAEFMLAVSTSSEDSLFHRTLYDHLEKIDRRNLLVKMASKYLESWIEEKNDHTLLFKYYDIHERNEEALSVMENRAISSDPISLFERMECLEKARNSASKSGQNSVRSHELQDKYDIARIQQRLLQEIESSAVFQQESKDKSEDLLKKLSTSLLTASELFNDFAHPYCLFDICLLLMCMCNLNDSERIAALWQCIISTQLPPTSSDPQVLKLLSRLRENSPFADKGKEVDTFEQGLWIPKLALKVQVLGRELYSSTGNFTFPVAFLARELELLRRCYDRVAGTDLSKEGNPWPLKCFLQVGCSYPALVDAYNNLFESSCQAGAEFSERLYYLCSLVELISMWVKDSKSWTVTGSSTIKGQLKNAIERGLLTLLHDLQGKLCEYRHSTDSSLSQRIDSMLDAVLDEIKYVR